MSKKGSLEASRENLPRCLKFLKNSSDNTIRAYFQSIRKYEEFHNTKMEWLVKEALTEQASNIPMHELSIIDRIEEFQEDLVKKELVYGTIKNHVTRIKSIYYKNRVQVPYIEPLNSKKTKRREYIEYKDILTKDEIKKALSHLRLPAQARVLVIAQGGLSNEECEHLSTRSFIDELHKYHKQDNDLDAMKWLADPNHPVIWVTRMIRVKTKKPYYAVIGCEAVNMIAEAKLYERDLPKNNGNFPEKLLDMNKDSFARICRITNQKCGFGLVSEESKFRSHNLRRFHATYIHHDSSMKLQEIDELQGRGKTATQDTYIKTDPLSQKIIYSKVLNTLSFWNEYEYMVTEDDVEIFLVNQIEKNKKLRKKINDLSSQLIQKRKASEQVKKLREELGNDVFDSMISDILNAN